MYRKIERFMSGETVILKDDRDTILGVTCTCYENPLDTKTVFVVKAGDSIHNPTMFFCFETGLAKNVEIETNGREYECFTRSYSAKKPKTENGREMRILHTDGSYGFDKSYFNLR